MLRIEEARFEAPINSMSGFYVLLAWEGKADPEAKKKMAFDAARKGGYNPEGSKAWGFASNVSYLYRDNLNHYTHAVWFYDRA